MASFAVAAGVISLLGVASPASAAEPVDDASEAITSWYEARNATPDVIENLIADYRSGIAWDSIGGEVAPASVETERDGAFEVTRTTYPDGSISESKIQVSAEQSGEFGTQSIGSCNTTTGGSGYIYRTDCYASGSNALVEIGFRVDYYTLSGAPDRISGIRSPYQYATGGSATTPTIRITREIESGSNPAQAKATSQVVTGGSSYTANVTLSVGGDTASTSQDF